jgi:PAS domain-containing protein
VKLAFSETSDERFLVTAEFFGSTTPGQCSHFTVTPYQDENAFLEAVVFADLPQDTMVHVTTAVLRSIESPGPLRWISVDLSARAQQVLGVAREGEQTSVRTSPLQMTEEFVSRLADVPGLEEVLLRSPTPFAISLGREHEIAFLNDAYAHLLGRSSSEGLVGKLVVEAMPELRDQPCVQLLDEVYRTGEPKVGIELKGKPRVDAPEEWREEYYELNYHPVRNYGGMVCGVMVQATDVTEKVLDRQVSASREAHLYWQWAELENIYRAAPMAICNFDAKEYRILRMNDLQAETMGAPAESLIGGPAGDSGACGLRGEHPEFSVHHRFSNRSGGSAELAAELQSDLRLGREGGDDYVDGAGDHGARGVGYARQRARRGARGDRRRSPERALSEDGTRVVPASFLSGFVDGGEQEQTRTTTQYRGPSLRSG